MRMSYSKGLFGRLGRVPTEIDPVLRMRLWQANLVATVWPSWSFGNWNGPAVPVIGAWVYSALSIVHQASSLVALIIRAVWSHSVSVPGVFTL